MEDYVIEQLARCNVLNAYPLMQLTEPQMSLRDWKNLALGAIGRRGSQTQGILVARRRARQYISGMVWFHTERDFAAGRVLAASHLVAVDILDSRGIMLDLVKALAVHARLQNCKQVRLAVAEGAALADMLPGALLEVAPRSRVDRMTSLSFAT